QASFVSENCVRYPFAIKVATGKIDAVSGKAWTDGLHRGPQDYMVAPRQPWLDGYCVARGQIRQFVAMPLGAGYSAEEQLTGRAEHGGLQIMVYPMNRALFDARFPKVETKTGHWWDAMQHEAVASFEQARDAGQLCGEAETGEAMVLSPGGRMRQEIYD